MKEIHLSNGRGIAKVSDEDFATVSQFRWHLHSAGYAYRAEKKGGKQTNFLMHREIMDCPKGLVVDHIDGDRLNNQRANLRIATMSQNNCNKPAVAGTSKLRGVSWHASRGKWRAVIKSGGKSRHLGYFGTEQEAADAYATAAAELHGEFGGAKR